MTAEQPAERVSLDRLLAHRDSVRALARRLVLDENDADDVEQETWRMAVEKPPRHAESLRAWLGAVVRNAARMSGRRSSRRARHESVPTERAPTPSPEDLVAAAELQSRLARAVLELDEPYRSTVLYRFHEGLEASEIAARVGVPVETVRTRLKRAIERLRERMDVDLGDDRDAWCLLLVGMRAADVKRFAPTTATSVGAALGGGLAMAAGAKLVVAAVVVAGAAWWLWPRGDAAERSREIANAVEAPSEPDRATPQRRVLRGRRPAVDERAATPDPKTDVAEVVAVVPPALSVQGRVVDQDGKPVEGAYVDLLRTGQGVGEPSVTTGADGQFVFTGVASGEWTLRHFAPQPRDEWSIGDELLVNGGDRDVVVVMRRVAPGTARLVATVVDETGAPLAPREAMVVRAEYDGLRSRSEPHGALKLETGRIEVDRMKVGRWRMWIRVPDRIGAVVPVEVEPGQTDVALTVVVGRPGKLRGRVDLGDSGLAMPHMVIPSMVDVSSQPQWGRPHGPDMVGAARVAPDGTFEFQQVMAGRWRVWLNDKGYMGEGFADVPAGGEGSAVVTFTRAGVVSFRLAAASPTSIIRGEVSQDDGPWRGVISRGGERGRTPTFDQTLKPGAYRWRVTFPVDDFAGCQRLGAKTAEGEVIVRVGETAVVDVPVVPK